MEVDTTADSTSLARVTEPRTSINSQGQFAEVLYPNPTVNQINIDFHENVIFEGDQEVDMKIVTLTGAVIATKKATSSQMSWDVSTLKSGVYFLNIETGTSVQQLKFLKM